MNKPMLLEDCLRGGWLNKKLLSVLVVGVVLGFGAFWYYDSVRTERPMDSAWEIIKTQATSKQTECDSLGKMANGVAIFDFSTGRCSISVVIE